MDAQPPESETADYEVLDFHPDTSHGHIVAMLQRRAERGIVLDLGCGSAPLAEPLRDAGFVYIGLDVNAHCLDALRDRGFGAHPIDLRRLEGLGATLDAAVAGQPGSPGVTAVLALDVIEHLVEPHVAVHAIASWMQERDVPLLGLSVPNVTHRDVAVKLLNARWELTATGLLDATHLRFFTAATLAAITAACGLVETDRMDTISEWSDQHRPVGSPLLHTTTPLGRFLADLRARADDHGATYQFVRLYEPAAVPAVAPPLPILDPAADPDVRIAVVAAANASDDDVATLRADLDAQTSTAWELVGHDAWSDVSCSHVAVVGPGQRLSVRWVEQFVEAGSSWHGMVLRCAPTDSPDDRSWPVRYEVADDEGARATPAAALAFPVAALGALGRDLGDTSATALHRLLRDVAPYCGVHDTGVPAVGATGPTIGDVPGGDDPGGDVPGGDDAGSLVLVERWIVDELAALRQRAAADADSAARLDALAAHGEALARDNDWLNAELRRTPVRMLRRLLRRPGGPTA